MPQTVETNTPTKYEMLTFRLGSEAYGIEILKVQEIRSCDPVTTTAGSPAFIRGVIDLRGVIVPIIDMRLKFNLAAIDDAASTVVIILNVGGCVIGIVVDAVSDVVHFGSESVRPMPALGAQLDTEFITGIARIEEQMVVLLDIERVLESIEMQPAGA